MEAKEQRKGLVTEERLEREGIKGAYVRAPKVKSILIFNPNICISELAQCSGAERSLKVTWPCSAFFQTW